MHSAWGLSFLRLCRESRDYDSGTFAPTCSQPLLLQCLHQDSTTSSGRVEDSRKEQLLLFMFGASQDRWNIAFEPCSRKTTRTNFQKFDFAGHVASKNPRDASPTFKKTSKNGVPCCRRLRSPQKTPSAFFDSSQKITKPLPCLIRI